MWNRYKFCQTKRQIEMTEVGSAIFAENAARQLQRDVDEIDDALAQFLKDRLSATKQQESALEAYEEEMLLLDGNDQEYDS